MNSDISAYMFFVAWGFVLIGLWGLSRFDAGKRIVYYVLWLAIVLILVTRYQEILDFIKQGIPSVDSSPPLPDTPGPPIPQRRAL